MIDLSNPVAPARCQTCRFCRSCKVIDPIMEALPGKFQGLSPERIEHKCHIQGKPQTVDPDRDWCYAYANHNSLENHS